MDGLPLAGFLELEMAKFVLIFARVAGIFSFAPIFSSQSLPRRFRMVVSLAITILMLSVVPAPDVAARTMIDMILMIVGEMLVGFILGSFLQFIFMSLQLAGQVVGTQFGLALANVVNPQLDDQVSTIGLTYLTVASLIFLSTGAHREMFAALLETFAVLPLGSINAHDSVRILALELFRESMFFTVRIAAPVTVGMLLTEIAMGFVGRTVPQLNVISIGFSLRIIVGLAITMLSLHGASVVFQDEVAETFLYGYEALVNLAPE